MLKSRLITVVLMRNGEIVQSRLFRRYQRVGRPATVVARLANWSCDELVFLDISREPTYDIGRDDLNAVNPSDRVGIVRHMAWQCAMPLSYGGRIRSVAEAEEIVLAGADKVSINTLSHTHPEKITELAKSIGSQAVIVSIDVLRDSNNHPEVMISGRVHSRKDPSAWAREVEARGAGEILLNSVNRDGTGIGYDIDLIRQVQESVSIPVIALGGAGSWEHLAEVCRETDVSAIAAANIFHHSENSVFECKRYLKQHGFPFRDPAFQALPDECLKLAGVNAPPSLKF
jgi:cyclase